MPRLDEVSVDLTVLGFGLAISIGAAFLFGLMPAVQISRQQPSDTLRATSQGSGDGVARQRLRSALTIVEVALSVALLIGAGLLFRSFWRLQQVEPGFDVTPLVTTRITLPRTTYPDNTATGAFYELSSCSSRWLRVTSPRVAR